MQNHFLSHSGPTIQSAYTVWIYHFNRGIQSLPQVGNKEYGKLMRIFKCFRPEWTHMTSNSLFSAVPCLLPAMSCLILCDPVDCSMPGSSVHGISWTRILEQSCHLFLQGSSQGSTLVSYASCTGKGVATCDFREGIASCKLNENIPRLPWCFSS